MQTIGVFHSTKKYPYDAATQATRDIATAPAWIEIAPQFQAGLAELDKFTHIWVIFLFDRNDSWKPLLMPPRGHSKKVGVFASRSPYRPNPVGLSALEIDRVEGSRIYVKNHDILDQTPVIDIKPYLPSADCFPQASRGWIEEDLWSVEFSELAEKQLDDLFELPNLRNFIVQQLSTNPFDYSRKRIRPLGATRFVLSYRTWRIDIWQTGPKNFRVESISSAYTESEMADPSDPYLDKKLHQHYNSKNT